MKTIILNKKARRNCDGKIFTCIRPDTKLGYFYSMVQLEKEGHNVNDLIEEKLVDLNPTRYTILEKGDSNAK